MKLKVQPLGTKFGHLTIVSRLANNSHAIPSKRKYHCQCVCGKRISVPLNHLKSGQKTHCGCKRQTPGSLHHEEYVIWLMMHKRCYDPTHVSYKHYGGRGITIQGSWNKLLTRTSEAAMECFARFLQHVGPRPSPLHTIDRFPDNDGPYREGNIRWATPKEQAQNKRRASTLPQSLPPQGGTQREQSI